MRSVQEPGHRRSPDYRLLNTGSVSSRDEIDLDQPGTCAKTGCIKKHQRSAGRGSHHSEESDCEQHGRNKRGECDGDHDAALATATKIARLSLCHIRSALRERLR